MAMLQTPCHQLRRVRPTAAAARSSSARPQLVRSRSTCVVRAELRQQTPQDTFSSFLKRYDFTSTMMGSLLVTGFCWSHGQPPLEALAITFSSTIVAVVANELLFSKEQ